MNKIEDFGAKIGGARKDMYISRESILNSIDELNEAEKAKMLKKDKLWPLPDAKLQVEGGMKPFVAYWIRTVRKMVSPTPRKHNYHKYVNAVLNIKERTMQVKTEADIQEFYDYVYSLNGEEKELWSNAVYLYDIQKIKYYHRTMLMKVTYDNFPYKAKSSTSKKKKGNFIPPQLENIDRTGIDYRTGRHITPDDWQKMFNFRGVEFGNWLSQADRQLSMNYCYDAFLDMCQILEIKPTDITFNGRLALAFGARGMSRAMAHYEPTREVINLTKMRGAGSTAHEWFHALDHHIAICYGDNSGTLASEMGRWSILPESFKNLMDTCKYNQLGRYTKFYTSSRIFDCSFSKDSHGYWSSNCEMLARAFACYCHDRYEGKSDYLFAHSESAKVVSNGEWIYAIPMGEERERINNAFDRFFNELKELKILNHQDKIKEARKVPEVPEFVKKAKVDFNLTVDNETGQFRFKL